MTGLVLLNLGTPDAPTPRAVRRYLREFLSDPRVIDLPAVSRWLLLNLVILPFRPKRSAEAYAKVWTDRGSPLLFHTEDLAAEVRARLGGGWQVEVAMRYGRPGIAGALDALQAAGAERIVVLPLYPQYASSTTGSLLEAVYREAGAREVVPALEVVPPFWGDARFIEAFVGRGRPVMAAESPDHVLFSYHGLPVRQVRKADPTGAHCLASGDCCSVPASANRSCYRFQCFETSRRLAAALGLPADGWSVSFQSRLGRAEWIRPYTDEVLHELAARGVRRLVVFSPAFVSDCLETIEEIGLRGRDTFLQAGGESFALVPSLNATAAWADSVAELAQESAGREGAEGHLARAPYTAEGATP